jgi:glutamyl-tRNA synthetase
MPPLLSADVIDRIFSETLSTPEALEIQYPPRDLPDAAMVTRVGPSPTGFMHIGTLYVGRICAHFAKQTGGVSILRIEDTDKKREVDGAVDFITGSFDRFGVTFDEGVDTRGSDHGPYGPYRQSSRRALYHSFVLHMLSMGKAYPCFATAEELEEMRTKQIARGLAPGYYGSWATWRDRPEADVTAALDAGMPFVIRFRSDGDKAREVGFNDLIFGHRKLPQSEQDIVIMKSDGLPTYHFAHLVDDHLMRVTHVIRGDEWLASVPTHLQLFDALGWEPPIYAHIAPINKMDGASRRKLSKRKDPEASVGFFEEQGYPREAVLDYLMTLSDSGFEVWKGDNPSSSSWEFCLSFRGLQGSSGPLFDMGKLGNISRNYIASLTRTEVYSQVLAWAESRDPELAELLRVAPETAQGVFGIERGGPNARKDIERWNTVKEELLPFLDESFALTSVEAHAMLRYLSSDELTALVRDFLAGYDPSDDKDIWFGKLKSLAGAHGFAPLPKDYKETPEAFKGTVADVAKVLRVLLMGRERTPDLYSVMQVLGGERVRRRLSLVL